MDGRQGTHRWRRATAALGVAALLGVGAVVVAPVTPPALAASPPDTVDTGDPPPPADPTTPGGLDEPAPAPDETVVEVPPVGPEIVPNANNLPVAWVGTPGQRPGTPALLTLQAAINAAPAGGTVSFDPNDYAFTGTITIPRTVTLDSSGASTLYTRFTVAGGGLTLDDDVTIGAANTGAIVSVTASDAVLSNLTIRNPTPVARPTGVQLGANVTGVVIDGLDMDGAGEASSYGINLTTGSATVTGPAIAGVATGIVATAASTAGGVVISGGAIGASTSGISLGTTTTPRVSGISVTSTPNSTGTGVDLANSSGALVDAVTVTGFARGFGTAPTNPRTGPTITGAVVQESTREGISLGATTGARITDARLTLAGANQSTGILTLLATGVVIERPTITGAMYGITTSATNTGAGPTITDPVITAFGGITLGSTQNAVVTGAVLDAGAWGVSGTGVNLVNAGRVTVSDVSATGFLYAIGAQSNFDDDSDRVNISISDIDVVGAPDASSGVYLLGARDATVSRVTADLTGAALVIHQSIGVTAQDITVTGHEGPTSVTGAAILRAYGSQDVDVDRASIDAGSYGFFYSATDGSTVTNATVANLVEYGVYGRSVANLDVGATTFTGNSGVGLFVVTTPANGISHDIAVHDSTMTDNDGGIRVLQGTTAVQVVRNTVSGQPDVVSAGPAHDLLVADNAISQTGGDGLAAISVAPSWADGALPDSYSSSDVRVTGNAFTGGGTWIQVGTADPASPEAARRTLRDDVLVTGNSFPAASTAIRTYANAVVGEDSAPALARALPVDGPVAVDARDHGTPNDWGAACRATGFLDGVPYYDGGGAEVYELTEAPVLYPMSCIDLSLTQALAVAPGAVLRAGDLVTWTLTPHNAGPRVAPAGWTITQLLPDGATLVSMTGDGYTVDGTTATATDDLPVDADGPPLTVTARVVAPAPGAGSMRDVAYVTPAPDTDLDEDGFVDPVVERLSPLVVPTIDTDTDASPTDNDAQGVWSTVGDTVPGPPSPWTPSGPGTGGAGGAGSSGPGSASTLSATGADAALAALAALLLLGTGIAVTTLSRRRPGSR
ncbi:beta strand repeat-containing protein [Oerskovia rustica]|uniref:Right-handed parallel beta-helix repeat-containing protein n=1 Tax=Oerskovia rustica TaxID=2762237 RepID=A0ABR8RQB8_9CELL|nr:NosD domain-containing protein [Oerskovia rustica]MBD7949982.1 right-handed parallel beta-helix repeat-containing protein [Oerskovia rustica]